LGRLAYFYCPSKPDPSAEPFAYFPCPSEADWGTGPLRSWHQLVARNLTGKRNLPETSRLLEFLLRLVAWQELRELAHEFAGRFGEIEYRTWVDMDARVPQRDSDPHFELSVLIADPRLPGRAGLRQLFGKLFNDAALTPDTDFVEKTLAFLSILESQS